LELGDSKVWDKPERAQELGRERAALEAVVRTLEDMETGLNDVSDLLEMAAAEDDTDTVTAIEADLDAAA
jgi:peptide chain release factor 2